MQNYLISSICAFVELCQTFEQQDCNFLRNLNISMHWHYSLNVATMVCWICMDSLSYLLSSDNYWQIFEWVEVSQKRFLSRHPPQV